MVNAPGGTGANAKVNGGTVFGKTGSAENAMGRTTHAWFCGYLVTSKPEIVVTVFLENAGGGGAMAAPITARIFNYYIGNLEKIKQAAPLPPQFRTVQEISTEDNSEETQDPSQTQSEAVLPEEQGGTGTDD